MQREATGSEPNLIPEKTITDDDVEGTMAKDVTGVFQREIYDPEQDADFSRDD
jgi:hypothetical protein